MIVISKNKRSQILFGTTILGPRPPDIYCPLSTSISSDILTVVSSGLSCDLVDTKTVELTDNLKTSQSDTLTSDLCKD